ncbi:hypothetical protein Tco_0597986 [Tanacetum coccineum]
MDDFRSSLSQLRPDAVTKSLMPSLDGSRRRRFMPAMLSLRAVSNTSSRIWCRSIISFISSPNESKSRVFPPNAIQKSDDASGSGGSVIDGLPIVTSITDIKLDGSNFFARSKTICIYLRRQKNISHIYSVCKAFHHGEQQDLSLIAYVMAFKKMYEELNSLLLISVDVKVIQKKKEQIASPHSSDSNSALVSHGGFQGSSRNGNSDRVGDFQAFNSDEVECYYYRELGRTTRNCTKLLAKKKGSSACTSATSDKTVTISAKEHACLKDFVNVNPSIVATAIVETKFVKVYGDQEYYCS